MNAKLFFQNSEGNEILKRSRLRMQKNIKMKLKKIALDWFGLDWISSE